MAEGPCYSSASLMYNFLYVLDDTLRSVMHTHAPWPWRRAGAFGLPATDRVVPYGSPGMSKVVKRILAETSVRNHKFFAMGGRADRLASIGHTAKEAGALFCRLFALGTAWNQMRAHNPSPDLPGVGTHGFGTGLTKCEPTTPPQTFLASAPTALARVVDGVLNGWGQMHRSTSDQVSAAGRFGQAAIHGAENRYGDTTVELAFLQSGGHRGLPPSVGELGRIFVILIAGPHVAGG